MILITLNYRGESPFSQLSFLFFIFISLSVSIWDFRTISRYVVVVSAYRLWFYGSVVVSVLRLCFLILFIYLFFILALCPPRQSQVQWTSFKTPATAFRLYKFCPREYFRRMVVRNTKRKLWRMGGGGYTNKQQEWNMRRSCENFTRTRNIKNDKAEEEDAGSISKFLCPSTLFAFLLGFMRGCCPHSPPLPCIL